jgi:RNA polymerase sigma-54 factor
MKNSLQLNLKQQLRLTPQLQQSIKLMSLSAIELKQEICNQLESNPFLEEHEITVDKKEPLKKDNDSIALNLDRDDSRRWDQQSPYSSSNFNDEHSNSFAPETLQDNLLSQLNLSTLTQRDKYIAQYIIDSIMPNGRLSESPETIHLSITQYDKADPITFEEVEVVRHYIQQLSPIGCACFDLKECLVAQLDPQSSLFKVSKKLIEHHIELLALQDYKKICRFTHLPLSKIKESIIYIKTLNPTPGNMFISINNQYITPDIILKKLDNNWVLELNKELTPGIQLSTIYLGLLKEPKDLKTSQYLTEKLNDAKHLLNSIHNRNNTLLKVGHYIIDKQLAFFEHGPDKMLPMTLQDVAQDVKLHESTISRITTHKYIATPQGTFELKYFFSKKFSSQTHSASSISIQEKLKTLIKKEDCSKPLSDNKLAELLTDDIKIPIARRTITKYRDLLSIPRSRDRKKKTIKS